MTAQVPRERRIGTIAYSRDSFGPDLLSPNGFPLLMYEWLVLRLSGTITFGAGAAGTVAAEAPFSLIKSIQVVVTGMQGDTFIEIPASDLRVLTHFIGRRPGLAPTAVAPATTAATTQPFSASLYLPFAFEDMSNPYRGFFASNRYASVRLRILWGNEENLVTGGGYATKVVDTITQVEVFGREYSFDPRFELAQDLLLNQRTAIKDVSINNVAQSNFDIEIPRTPSFLRGVLMKQYTLAAGVETPITTLISGEQQVVLLYNDTDRKFEYKFAQLQNQNTEMYRAALPTGYTFIDLSPRGDFSLLQNMINLQKIQLRVDNNAVANAFLRLTLVKYALSA